MITKWALIFKDHTQAEDRDMYNASVQKEALKTYQLSQLQEKFDAQTLEIKKIKEDLAKLKGNLKAYPDLQRATATALQTWKEAQQEAEKNVPKKRQRSKLLKQPRPE